MNLKNGNSFDIRSIVSKPEFATVAIFIAMLTATAILQHEFFSMRVMRSNINVFTPLVLLTIGQSVVIISGGLDLSSGNALALMLCFMTRFMDRNYPATGIYALLICMIIAFAAGLLNGIAVGYLRLPAVIATFANSYIFLGAAMFLMPMPGGQVAPWFPAIFDLRVIEGLPTFLQELPPSIFMIILACFIWFFISRTRTGRYIYAVGSHNQNAYDSGINAPKIQTIAYIFNAYCIFLCAVFFAAQNGSGSALIGDGGLTIQSIAAAVIGGIAISGGRGSVYMGVIGAIIISLVSRLIFLLRIPNAFQTLASGVIVILAISLSALYVALRKRSLLKGGE